MMRRFPVPLAILMLAAPLGAWGQEPLEGAGTEAFQFLNMGNGARIEAMGRAGTALADGSDAWVWNPALARQLRHPQFSATYFNWLDGVKAGSATGSVPIFWGGSVGFTVQALSVEDFGNVPGEPSVGQSDLAAGLGVAYALGPLDLGVGAKAIRSALAEETATGMTADLGANLRLWKGWNVAAAVRNFGQAFGYVDGVEEEIPTQAALGFGARFWELHVGADVLWEDSPGLFAILGAEYWLRDRVALRAGSYLGEVAEGAASPWSAGVGFRVRPGLDIDYAFRDGTFNASHRLGVRWTPGRERKSMGYGDWVRSGRQFYIETMYPVLDACLMELPRDIQDTVVVRCSTDHPAREVISIAVAERLRAWGLDALVVEHSPTPSGADSVSAPSAEAGDVRGHPTLEYAVVASDYSILREGRARLFGPRTVERRAVIDLTFALRDPGVETPVWTATARNEDTEKVEAKRVPVSPGYPQAGDGTATAEPKKLNRLVEPVVVAGIVTGLAVIFFSNRNVGE